MLGKRKLTLPYPYAKSARTVTLPAPARRMRSRRGNGVTSVSLFQTRGIPPELKSFDYVNGGYNPGNDVANPVPIFNPQTGTGDTRVIGRKCVIKSVQARFGITVGLSTVAAWNTGLVNGRGVRLMIVYDKSPQGATPLITDILVSNTTISPLNLNNSDRFIILFDKVHDMGSNAAITGNTTYTLTNGENYKSDVFYKKVSLPFDGPSSAGGIGGISTGGLFFYAVTDYSDATDNTVVGIHARIRYVDN